MSFPNILRPNSKPMCRVSCLQLPKLLITQSLLRLRYCKRVHRKCCDRAMRWWGWAASVRWLRKDKDRKKWMQWFYYNSWEIVIPNCHQRQYIKYKCRDDEIWISWVGAKNICSLHFRSFECSNKTKHRIELLEGYPLQPHHSRSALHQVVMWYDGECESAADGSPGDELHCPDHFHHQFENCGAWTLRSVAGLLLHSYFT